MFSLPSTTAATWSVFAATYFGLALGRVPGLRIDRTGIALVGAAGMLIAGAISLPQAAAAIDYETILLLFSMMIVVAHLELAGFFGSATRLLLDHCSSPLALLAVTIGLSGTLSAFLVNDIVCVALTPLVLEVCRRLSRDPIPYLVGVATSANIGSVATITGNPQNIIIGSLSSISYLRFASRLAPVAAIGLLLNFLIVAIVYRRQLSCVVPGQRADAPPHVVHRPLLLKSLLITLGTVLLFFAGFPIALVALGAAALLLLERIRPAKVYEAVDWRLLVMFVGLFVVVRAFELNVVRDWNLDQWTELRDSPVVLLSGLSVLLSNLVSNVPAVLLFKPIVAVIHDQEQAWLALAMSSTLAGNLTILGSVANLIVVENARRSGAELGFVEYLRVGIPLTLLTTLVGMGWLEWTRY